MDVDENMAAGALFNRDEEGENLRAEPPGDNGAAVEAPVGEDDNNAVPFADREIAHEEGSVIEGGVASSDPVSGGNVQNHKKVSRECDLVRKF